MEEHKKHPKVLIVGHAINLRTGGGITLYNLFKDWPKDKLLVAANKIDKEGTELCKKYYRFGYHENKRPWPLNKFQPYYKSEEVIVDDSKPLSSSFTTKYGAKESSYNKKLKKFIENIIHFLGIYYFLFPLKPSKNFVKWIEKEQPDILYTQLGSSESVLFINKLKRIVNIPIVVHIMDDWIKLINRPGLSWVYWNPKVNNSFKNILAHAKGHLSICDEMSKEYQRRYGPEFTAFHNCIDFAFWNEYAEKSTQDSTFTILYAGRIGKGTSNSIVAISDAVEAIENEDICFEVQCSKVSSQIFERLKRNKKTIIKSYIPYEELPKKFSSADLLVLPMDFDNENLKFIRYSMPTKVPEYMASGTPILVYANKQTALSKYASLNKWAYVINKNETGFIKNEIAEIIKDEALRNKISQTAIDIAKKNHIGKIVRKNFFDFLQNIMK